jgi:hypothetical protein
MCEECEDEKVAPRQVLVVFECDAFVPGRERPLPPELKESVRSALLEASTIAVGWKTRPMYTITVREFPTAREYRSGPRYAGEWKISGILVRYGKFIVSSLESCAFPNITHFRHIGVRPTIWCVPCDNGFEPSPAHPCISCGELCCDIHESRMHCAGESRYDCKAIGCRSCMSPPDVHYNHCEYSEDRFCKACYKKECAEPWCSCEPRAYDRDEDGTLLRGTERGCMFMSDKAQ